MDLLRYSIGLFARRNKSYLLTIVAIGYLVYFNSLFNGFVLDDLFQILGNPNVIGWHNLFYFFTHEIGPYYRPLMLTTFSVFYNFGLTSFFYHLFQVTLHILNSVMIFTLLFSLLNRKRLSLFLTLIFLVHPIVAEAVDYASLLQDVYFVFFGLLGLLLVKNGLSNKKLFIFLPAIQILSLLSKETAILFILAQAVFAYFFQGKYIVKQALSSLIVVLAYFSWRVLLFGSVDIHRFATVIPNSPSTVSLGERITNIPEIILFYIRTFLFPKNLAVSQLWWNKTINIESFYLPLTVDLITLIALISLGIYVYRKRVKDFKIFFFFGFWVLIGLGFHSQIIPLDWTVAERWFYFPIIGILGIIGVGLKNIELKKEKNQTIALVIAIVIISLLSLRTMLRNTDWYSQLSLTSHDIKISKDSGDLELNLGVAFIQAGKYQEAIVHLERATQLIPEGYTVWDSLGAAYANSKKYDQAAQAFKKAINLNKNYYTSYVNLVKIYLFKLKSDEAKQLLKDEALKRWPNDPLLWRYLGFADILLKDDKGALEAFKKAYDLSPDELNTYYYFSLRDGKKVILHM